MTPLKMACSDNERTRPLIDGTVRPRGLGITVTAVEISEMFHRMLVRHEFDVSEMSLGSYLVAHSRGRQITAIPVFPLRNFRHSYIFCNVHSGIREPLDLMGKKVGIHLWQNTAAVWLKGYLFHDFDVPLESVKWVSALDESYRIPLKAPNGISLTSVRGRVNLEELLDRGEIDALMWPKIPEPFLRGSPNIQRLFPDYLEVEKGYYRRTSIFPIMHTVVMKKLLRNLPYVAHELVEAFNRAKAVAFRRMVECSDRYGYCWSNAWMEEERRIFLSRDPYPYDLPENAKALSTFIQFAQEQGLIRSVVEPESIFTNPSS